MPGFTDSHVHFPTWALAQNEVKLDGCATLDEALAADRAASRPGPDAGCAATAGAAATGSRSASRRARTSTRSPATRPPALIAKDYHSLWLNSAALALASGDLEVDGGVVERDAAGEPTGVLREEAAWRFKERHMIVVRRRLPRRDARRRPPRELARRHRGARQGRLARRAAALAAARGARPADAARLAVDPARPRSTPPWPSACAPGSAARYLRLGYLKVFMDGTLGSQTAWMLDGSGVQITSGAELAEIVRRGAAAGFPVAVHAIGDRANREALDAFEADEGRLGAARAAPAHRARAAARARGPPALRRARRHLLGAVLARAVRPRPRRRLLGRARPTVRTRSGRCSTPAPSS